MDTASLLDHPLVQVAIAGAIGFLISEWRSNSSARSKSLQVDTDVLARLGRVEQDVAAHVGTHACVTALRATVEADIQHATEGRNAVNRRLGRIEALL